MAGPARGVRAPGRPVSGHRRGPGDRAGPRGRPGAVAGRGAHRPRWHPRRADAERGRPHHGLRVRQRGGGRDRRQPRRLTSRIAPLSALVAIAA
ncbi:hypothetical protein ND808_40740 [Streptomyces sp. DR7-3]|nr:hypothetical protein [Streptomyces sp. DR7-3]